MGGDLGPEVGGLLGNGAGDTGSLHLALGVHDDTGVILEEEHGTVLAAPRLALTDDGAHKDLLAELWLTLLDGAHDEVTETRGGETVKTTVVVLDGDDVQVLSTGVIGAVDDGSDGESEGNAELATLSVSLLLSHLKLLFEIKKPGGKDESCRFIIKHAEIKTKGRSSRTNSVRSI